MTLELRFQDLSVTLPTLIIWDGEKSCRCRHARWVQLFALMIFRKIKRIDQGNVGVGDLSRLFAFHRTSPSSSSKWLSNTAPRLPRLMVGFLKSFTSFRLSGPYRILISQEQIVVDVDLLVQYLRLVYSEPKRFPASEDTQFTGILNAANAAMAASEFETAQVLFGACLSMFDSVKDYPPIIKPLLYDRLALLENILHGQTQELIRLHSLSQRSAKELRSLHDRRLSMSLILVNLFGRTPKTESNLRQLSDIHHNVSDIASQLPKNNCDRASILARNHSLKAIIVTKFNQKDNVKAEIDAITGLNRFLEDNSAPKYVPVSNSRTLELNLLKMDLLKLQAANQPVTESVLLRYHDLIGESVLKGWNTLPIAEQIGEIYIRTGHLEEANLFLTEALLRHSYMHRSLIHRRAMATRQQLLVKLDGVVRSGEGRGLPRLHLPKQ